MNTRWGVGLAAVMLACSSTKTVHKGVLPLKEPLVAPATPKHQASKGSGLNEAVIQQIKKHNQKAGHPTFGLIQGFYQLPVAKPLGAVLVEHSENWFSSKRLIQFEASHERTFAITPLSPHQSQIFAQSITQLMDAGVRFVEVPTAQAMALMEQEKQLLTQKNFKVLLGTKYIPKVDYLISIQKGLAESGPVYMGRVIRLKDGRLYGFEMEPDVGVYSVAPLVQRLISSSLKHIAMEHP